MAHSNETEHRQFSLDQKTAFGAGILLIIGAPTYGVYIKNYPDKGISKSEIQSSPMIKGDLQEKIESFNTFGSNWYLASQAGKVVAKYIKVKPSQ